MNRPSVYRLRRFGILAVVLGLAVVGPIGLPTASADGSGDQITGTGLTNSAVTASWSDGLLSADDKTIVRPRDPNSPLSFMYPDFQNLKITVSQTQNLVHQAISVTWTGLPSNGTNGGFLQLMQCYGDDANGPDPSACEFGTPSNLLPSGLVNVSAGSRGGAICAPNSVPSKTNPPHSLDGSGPSAGCDTAEPSDKTHLDPTADNQDSFSVPFIPVGSTQPLYQTQLSNSFDQFSTNEVQQAISAADGSGQNFFQALTATQAPGLGCGTVEDSGSTRDCWLVAVPRGTFDANGFQIHGNMPQLGNPAGSPLGASLWAQRIQIHLGFAPIAANCPIGSAQERETAGTGLVSHAVFSWQLALNAAANCRTLYGYSQVPESTSTNQLNDLGGDGLAFTTIPIGSEATRITGGPPSTPPPLVYAPVATSAITFGFNVNLPSTNGFDSTPIKLTPRLLAKVLTQSYRFDLVDFFPSGNQPGPDWAQHNPLTIAQDPEFLKLNPSVTDGGVATSLAPLLTEDHSGVNEQVWAWIKSDPATRTWLSGTPDENGMVINPFYQKLNLGGTTDDSYPRADPTCHNTKVQGEKDPGRCAIDLLPYQNDLETAAARVRGANDPLGPGWDPNALAPDGSAGWWSSGTLEGPNTTFMWTITDSANLAAYGLVPAQLCHADGSDCVSPSSTSMAAALSAAQPDSTGLVHVDPAAPGAGAYPLVDVTYAAVRTTQSPPALNDFATLIEYAAGPGQAAGVDPGQLPHGYLPLPDNLKAQALAAAATLRADAVAQPTTPATTGDTSGTTDTSGGGGASPAAAGGGAAPAGAPATPPTSAPPGAAGTKTNKLPAVLAARHTPADHLPAAMRWAVVAIVIVGVVGALGGGLLRSTDNPLINLLTRRFRR
ncbi:MAG TPA: hypothetical protein VH352_26540 [Pseudonocardiaceae bacterium]|nr:hypothetical protein [Pseudonocardiaceae bacterium]